MKKIVGIPNALGYHRYGVLWETFLQELNVPFVVSTETNGQILAEGTRCSVDETCLPAKLYLGHVASLVGRCDSILVPRLQRLGREEEFCVRFWGLYDTVQTAFPNEYLLSYELKSERRGHELNAFLQLGRSLGKPFHVAARAYQIAKQRQDSANQTRIANTQAKLQRPGTKILIATQSYIAHDPYLGGVVAKQIRRMGAEPLFTDGWDQRMCRAHYTALSTDLYWITNQEILGAITLAKGQIDGIILLTAFPCGSDCLANELVLRRVQGVPLIQILLDEQQGQEGLATRIESFLDMLEQRKCAV